MRDETSVLHIYVSMFFSIRVYTRELHGCVVFFGFLLKIGLDFGVGIFVAACKTRNHTQVDIRSQEDNIDTKL